MNNKKWRGVFGALYKIQNKLVMLSDDEGESWSPSNYGFNLALFHEGVRLGYLKEVK